MFNPISIYKNSNLIFIHSLKKCQKKRVHFLQQTYQSFLRLVFTSILIIGLALIPQWLFSQQSHETTWNDSILLPLLIIDTYGEEITDRKSERNYQTSQTVILEPVGVTQCKYMNLKWIHTVKFILKNIPQAYP